MTKSIGERIRELRRARGITQEEMAEAMGVTSQAVSKWETDLSIPDLPTLIRLADYFNVSLDALCREQNGPEVRYETPALRKRVEDMFFRIRVLSSDGDKVNVNLPLALVKALDLSDLAGKVSFGGSDVLKDIDLDMIMRMVENGAVGKLIEVDSADGDHVEVYVE